MILIIDVSVHYHLRFYATQNVIKACHVKIKNFKIITYNNNNIISYQ